jgi:acetyl-CoA acetyltransferase
VAVVDLVNSPVYIAGVAETPLGEVWDQTENSMFALAAREALNEAGLTLRDVDGIFVNYMGEEGAVQVAEYLGVTPRYADSTDLGGAAFEAHLHHAMLAVACGRCDVALIGHASRQRTRRLRRMVGTPDDSLMAQFELPAGIPRPMGAYALVAARHMYEFGTTSRQLAEVAVAARQWAQMNPKAWSRDPLSIDDVVNSRMLVDPIHRYDACLVTDGGAALVVTNAGRARNAARKAIRILGAGESSTHWHLSQWRDLTKSAGVISGREAFAMAGIRPSDVDFVEPYDSFTITVLMALEDLGFCRKGEGGPFVESGALRPGGDLPAMTSGGGLSYNHPGALGALLLVEAVRQLRWEAGERQIADPQIGVVHGVGGFLSTCSTVVLGRD